MTDYKFGSFRFRDVEASEALKNSSDYEPQVLCITCNKIFKLKSMKKHVETHDRREERRLDTIAKRELGMRNHKVLKGQGTLF